MRETIIVLLLLVCALASAQERAEVELETTEGNIRIALFNETPQHRDNFMKLVRMQFYDSLLVHRVIKDFMIQTGDEFSDMHNKSYLSAAKVTLFPENHMCFEIFMYLCAHKDLAIR